MVRSIVVLLLTASTASAQTVIAGRVVDRAKKVPLEKVAVELVGATDSVLATGATGSDGTFTLVAPAAGTYRVRITPPSSDGFLSDTLRVSEGEYLAREFLVDESPRAYFEFEVTKPVVPARGTVSPRYPADLRQSGVSGCATVSFVVDTLGRADRSTTKLVAYSHREFVQAVWDALPKMQFIPAEIDGRKVRQRVFQPFTFAINDDRVECKSAPAKP